MGRRVVKQPDGMYAMWETTADDFTHVNLTEQEVEKEFVDTAILAATIQARDEIDIAEGRHLPPGRFKYDWNSSLDLMRRVHGAAAVKKLLEEME